MSAANSAQASGNAAAVRPAVRYEAQAAPSEGSRSAAEAKKTAWVGAFERVLGDHPDGTTPSDRSKLAKAVHETRSPTSDSQYRDSLSATDRSGIAGRDNAGSEADGPSAARDGAKASPRRPALAAQRSKPLQRSSNNGSEEVVPRLADRRGQSTAPSGATGSTGDSSNATLQPSSHTSSRALSHKRSTRALRPTPASSTAPAPPKAVMTIRSYAPEPEDDGEAGRSNVKDPTAGLYQAKGMRGPRLVEVYSRHQHDKVIFDDLYLNHAPGLQPVRLKSILEPGKSVLIRLQSDLGHAVSFMRRKRTAPKNELDKLVWPSNSLDWAKGDGLSPAKLRQLRHISTNLEVADSLILEGGASTEVFVILRPGAITSPAGPSTTPAPPGPSRSSSQSSAVTSPCLMALPVHTLPPSIISPRSKSPIPTDSGEKTLASQQSPSGEPSLARQDPNANLQDPVDVLGKVSIRAWPLPTLEPATPNASAHLSSGSIAAAMDESSAVSSESSAASSRPDSHYGSALGSGGPSSSSIMTEMSSDVEPQSFDLELKARFCRPELTVNVRQPGSSGSNTDTGTHSRLCYRTGVVIVDFGDVVAGEIVSTDLHLSNHTAIDCFWQAKVDCGDDPDVSPSVSIEKAETLEPIALVLASSDGPQYQPNVLAPRSNARLKLHLRPEQGGIDMEELLVLSNLHNTSNSVRLLIKANIVPQNRDTALLVEPERILDFGDCCGGQWTRQLLVIKNAANYSLDVALSAQKGHEVRFQQAGVVSNQEYDQGGEDILIGATAASSDGVKSDTGGSSKGSASVSFSHSPSSSQSAGVDARAYQSLALELTRTPTHHPTVGSAFEPPVFHLADSETVDVEKTPMTLTPQARPVAPKHSPDDPDDFDSSSVQSQAGSRPSSPSPHSEVSEMEMESDGASSPHFVRGSRPKDVGRRKSGPKDSVLAWREASRVSETGSSHGSSVGDEQHQDTGARSIPSTWSSASSPRWKRVNSSGTRDEDEVASFTSESTTFSHESSSVSGVSSSQAQSAASAARAQYRVNLTAQSSALRSVQHSEEKELEDLTVRPGEEVRIIVSFRPAKGEFDQAYSAGRLLEHRFRLNLDYAKARGGSAIAGGGSRLRGGRERKTVLCHTRTCTSFIGVSPQELDFGEANVGSRRSSQIVVSNYSELSARVDLRFVSKVLSMYRDEMTIPAGQSIHLSVDHSPRRVNLAYSKQITVANLLNRQNDQIIEVRSKNVDKQRISFHSLLYRILTPNGSNFLEFGDVNINSSRIRSFSIENVTQAGLTLDITAAHPEDIGLYVKAPPQGSSVSPARVPATPSALTGGSTKTINASGKGYEDHEPTGSVMARALPAMLAAAREGEDGQPAIKAAKGAELKERFLETISSDTPAHIRQENTSWRMAQKLSHYRKDAAAPAVALGEIREGGQASGAGNGHGTGSNGKKAGQVNLVAALRKGGKGRSTMSFGNSVTFKDRTLVQEFEYLDLATGPPIVAKRISTKSRCFQLLEQLETMDRSGQNGSGLKGVGQDGNAVTYSPSSGTIDGVNSRGSHHIPMAAQKRLPNNLTDRIKSKAATSLRSVTTPASDDANDGAPMRSPALTAKRKLRQTASDPTDVSNLTLDELLVALESQPNALSTLFFNSAQAEEKHVRTEINLQRELRHAIETRQLIPLGMLRIPPGEERQVVAVFNPNGSTRPHILGTARKQDSRIFLRLVEYDLKAVRASEEFSVMADLDKDELPIRDLMVRTTVCRALLELGQPHINFGQMEKGETKTKKILIHNRSEWSARYCIRKSGSIASGDIKLSSGRYGVVPAHGKREVEFIFSPSLTGAYQEKLVIENVADRDRDLTVSLKATVRRKPNFSVEPVKLDFGECRPGKLAEALSFTISNTTNQARTFVVAIDASDLRHQRTIMDMVFSTTDEGQGRATLSKAEETSIAEELEHISQKLKIANRKGQGDKIKKYEGRLAELSVKTGAASATGPSPINSGASAGATGSRPASPLGPDNEETEVATYTGSETSSANTIKAGAEETTSRATLASFSPSVARLKRVSSTVTIGVGANSSKRIFVRVRISSVHTALTAQDSAEERSAYVQEKGGEDIGLNVLVHEVKNQDETRVVVVQARALWSSGSDGTKTTSTRHALAPGTTISKGVEGDSGSSSSRDVVGRAVIAMDAGDGVGESERLEMEEGEMDGEVADPLPVHDSSAVIFTSDCQT